MTRTGWVGDDGRADGTELSEILHREASFSERRAERHERELVKAEMQRRMDAHDAAEFDQFKARMLGHEPLTAGEVMTRASGAMDREGVPRSRPSRMQRLRDLIERHDPSLSDLLPDRLGGVCDPNLGFIAPDASVQSKAAIDRARRDADERRLGVLLRQRSQDREFIARVQAQHRGEAVR